MLAELNKEDALWLLNVYQPQKDGMINQSNISMFTKAINLIRGTNISNPSCGCQYKTQAQIAKSYFEQYKSDIEKIANS